METKYTYIEDPRSMIMSVTEIIEENQDKLEEEIIKLNNRLDTGELDDLRLLYYLTYNEKLYAIHREIIKQYMTSSDAFRSMIIDRVYDMDQRQDKLSESIKYLGTIIILLCIIMVIFFFKLEGI